MIDVNKSCLEQRVIVGKEKMNQLTNWIFVGSIVIGSVLFIKNINRLIYKFTFIKYASFSPEFLLMKWPGPLYQPLLAFTNIINVIYILIFIKIRKEYYLYARTRQIQLFNCWVFVLIFYPSRVLCLIYFSLNYVDTNDQFQQTLLLLFFPLFTSGSLLGCLVVYASIACRG